MLRPQVLPGMEEGDQRVAVGIAAGEIRALEEIAVVACESEVQEIVRPTMLAGDDVLYVVSVEWLPTLVHPTIFTTFLRASDDGTPNRIGNRHSGGGIEFQTGLRLQ